MATLTTSWKSYDKKEYTIYTGQKLTLYLEAKYSTQSIQDNTTTIYTRLRSTVSSGTIYGDKYKFTCSYCPTVEGSGRWTFTNTVITESGQKIITHNFDGTKSLTLKASIYNQGWGFNWSLSADVNLPKINRTAIITNVDNFTDSDNPIITFSNPNNFIVKPYLKFYDNNNELVHTIYRDIQASSPYEFTLTTMERQSMTAATNQQQVYNVQVGLETYNGSTKIGEFYVTRQMSYENAEPYFITSFLEINNKVINLIGNTAEYILQNESTIQLSIIETIKKGATLSKIEFINGTQEGEITTSPYKWTVDKPTTGEFIVKLTDSRGFYAVNRYVHNLITYEPVTISNYTAKRLNPGSNDINLNATIRYYDKTFGTTPNQLKVYYKINEEGNLILLPSTAYTIDTSNNKAILNTTLTNLIPYTDSANLYLVVKDIFDQEFVDMRFIPKGTPTFEAGEHDFQVNGDLLIADIDRNNRINVKDELYYKAGDTYDISGSYLCSGGFLSTSATVVYFSIYLPKTNKSYKDGKHIEIDTINFDHLVFRSVNGYLDGTSTGIPFSSFPGTYTLTTSFNENVINFEVKKVSGKYKNGSTTTDATNNMPVAVTVHELEITFKEENN